MIVDKIIDCYFAPSSPWTYLGHRRLVELAVRCDATIKVKPIDLMGRVYPVSGGLSMSKRPKQRLVYRAIELKRWSTYLGIPLNLSPKFFPVDGDLSARMIVAADISKGTASALKLAEFIMTGVWVKERNIADPEVLHSIAIEAEMDGTALLALAVDPVVHDRYSAYTQEAIDRQVFGAPFYMYGDEPFWGQDRLDFLERALRA